MNRMVNMGANEGGPIPPGAPAIEGMSAMGRAPDLASIKAQAAGGQPAAQMMGAQPQAAQVFNANAIQGQLRKPEGKGMNFNANPEVMPGAVDADKGIGGGQQLDAGEPINDQQMEGMMPVMPNVGGDGSGLGLGMGGQWAIYQEQLRKQQEILDQANQGGGGGGGGGGIFDGGDGGGFDPGGGGFDPGGGDEGGVRKPGPKVDVINPNDPGGGGGSGGRPPVRIPFPGGGFGSDEPQIFTGSGGGVQGSSIAAPDQYDWNKSKANLANADQQTIELNRLIRAGKDPRPRAVADPNQQQPPPQYSGTDGGAKSYDQMVAQSRQRASDSYNAQVAAGGHQDYFDAFGGTSISPRGTYEENRAALDADNAWRQSIGNAQQKNRQPGPTRPTTGGGYPVPSLAGLSSQASGGQGMPRSAQVYPQGPSTGMPMGQNQSMAQAPQSLPSAPGMSMPQGLPIKRKAKGGLGALANQASGMGMMKKPNLTYG
jgi:hypothetical protein